MVEDIEATAAKLRSETQTTVLGPDAVQAQKHESRPARPKKSYAPLFHAFSCRLRRELYDAYHLFLAAFRDASEKLRSGDRNAKFPTSECRRRADGHELQSPGLNDCGPNCNEVLVEIATHGARLWLTAAEVPLELGVILS
jgi:hypothetical protein